MSRIITNVTCSSVMDLVEQGIQKAFETESIADMDNVLQLVRAMKNLVSKGHFNVASLQIPDLSWRLNEGYVPDFLQKKMGPGKFEILCYGASASGYVSEISQYDWSQWRWTLKHNSSDILAFRIIGEQ